MKVINKYFSLIEILVVAAIFMILFSLLQPSLKKVLSHTRKIECSNQLFEMGLATSFLLNDTDDMMPGMGGLVSPHLGFRNYWFWMIGPYMEDGKYGRRYCYYSNRTKCPTTIEIYDLKPRVDRGNSWVDSSYGMNRQTMQRKIIEIPQPSKIAYLLDGKKTRSTYWYRHIDGHNYNNINDFVHSQDTNALHLDNHVESYSFYDIPKNLTDGLWRGGQ
jgi:hypothetical protein